MSNMTTVRLPDDLLAAMEKLKSRDGMPVSEQIRRGLMMLLAKKKIITTRKKS